MVYPSYVTPAATPTVPAGTTITPTESFVYDAAGNLTAHTDRRGSTTTYQYDSANRISRTTRPAVGAGSGIETRAYDDTGLLKSVVNEIGTTTGYDYNMLDHLIEERVTVPASANGSFSGDAITRYGRNSAGAVIWARDPAGVTTNFVVDALGRTTTTTDPSGFAWTTVYDQGGRIVESTDPLGRKTVSSYDLAGRPTSDQRRNAAGTTITATTYQYDANSNRTHVTLARGGVFVSEYDALNRLVKVSQPTQPTASIAEYGYDLAGNSTKMWNNRAGSPTTWTTYNPWDLTESILEPSTAAHPAEAARTYTNVYDAGGLAVREIQPGAVTIDRTFDARGRLTAETGTGSPTGVNGHRTRRARSPTTLHPNSPQHRIPPAPKPSPTTHAASSSALRTRPATPVSRTTRTDG